MTSELEIGWRRPVGKYSPARPPVSVCWFTIVSNAGKKEQGKTQEWGDWAEERGSRGGIQSGFAGIVKNSQI
jgi:hypothetical protein